MLVALLKRSTTCRHESRCIFTVSNIKIPNAYCFEIKDALYITWEKGSLNKQTEEATIEKQNIKNFCEDTVIAHSMFNAENLFSC